MKIIQLYKLLGMIKSGIQPHAIRFHNCNWQWDNNCKDYYNVHYKKLFDGVLSGNLTSSLNDIVEDLDDRFELLEEPKGIPKKLEILPNNEHYSNKVLYGKINEIIDYLKSKGE